MRISYWSSDVCSSDLYVAIGLLQTTVVLALGMWLFEVPVRGGVLDVYVASMLLIVANLTLGLLISTRAQSQFQAMQMTFFVFLPSILMSGFMFPFAGMPRVVPWLAAVLQLHYFMSEEGSVGKECGR